jgi:hypothetical protein
LADRKSARRRARTSSVALELFPPSEKCGALSVAAYRFERSKVLQL